MSRKSYPAPARPPRISKMHKSNLSMDTSGRLMNIIAELSVSNNNDDRKNRMHDLKKDFDASDARLVQLISGQREQLSLTMEAFSKISTRINASRKQCREVKENLIACKKLLQCKRNEIQLLWSQSVEHGEVIGMLKEIEELNKVNEKVEECLNEKNFLKATELLVSAMALLDGKLSAADALKDLKNELNTLKKKLHTILVEELVSYLYQLPSHVFLQKNETDKKRNYEDVFSQTHTTIWKFPTEGQNYDFSSYSNYESISVILNCISMLNMLSETVEALKENCSKELHKIIKNCSEVMRDILENSSYPCTGSQSQASQTHLLDLLNIILYQFRFVAINHYAFLDNMERISMTKGLKDVPHYEIADIYSKIQTVVEVFITDYLDLHNTAATQRVAAFSKKVPSATDISSFFLRKGPLSRSKKHCLFKFDASSHAISKESFLQEQAAMKEKDIDSVEFDQCLLLCQPTLKNITIIYKPLKKFIFDIENALQMECGTLCPLHTFLTDCVKMFLDQVSIETNRLIDRTSISLEAWKPVTDMDELKIAKSKTQVLSSTLALNSTLVEMEMVITHLPDYASHFLQLICHILQSYKDQCNKAYKGLVSVDSGEQRIFSISWSQDSDISRLLRSLPNWTNLGIKDCDDDADFEESPEEIRFRNKQESELLIRNLSSKESISINEIISDHEKLKNLALMHESMEWFSNQITSFAESLPDVQASMLALMPDKYSEENDGNIEFAVGMSTKATLKKLSKDFEDVSNTCLLVLHLEVRAHCFYHLLQLSKQSSYVNRKDDEEPEPEVAKLNADLSKIDEVLSPVLQPKKIKYIFEGLGELLSTILIKNVTAIKKINENGLKKMGRNIFAIQQNLAGITMIREVALDRARHYFDLLNHSYEDILNQIVEEGPQFQEHEYSAIIQLLHNSREGTCFQDSLSSYLEKLHQILDEVAVSV